MEEKDRENIRGRKGRGNLVRKTLLKIGKGEETKIYVDISLKLRNSSLV